MKGRAPGLPAPPARQGMLPVIGYRVRIELAIGPPWEITLGEADFRSLADAWASGRAPGACFAWGGILLREVHILEVVPEAPGQGPVPAAILVGKVTI